MSPRSLFVSLGLWSQANRAIVPRGDATPQLAWTACDLDFPPALATRIIDPIECATLEVPLDYSSANSTSLLLQLIRVKALQQPVKGSLVFSPGGPGFSGVEEVATNGGAYVAVLRDQYDIIGFDPRGVGRTIPFSCSPSSSLSKRSDQDNRTEIFPTIDALGLFQNKAWQDGGAFAERCKDEQDATGNFLSTPYVARDLLKITEAVNEDGQLRFWGRSYGTILGQTFASMFPDRVQRMLLDSVVSPNDYYAGQWLTVTRDTVKSLLHFFKECMDAGSLICPLASLNGDETSAESLMDALVESLEEVKAQNLTLPENFPVAPWWASAEGLPLLGQLKTILLRFVYRPNQYFTLASLVNQTLSGDFSPYLDFNPDDIPPPEPAWNLGTDAFHGVACLDSAFRASNPGDMYSSVQAQLQGGGTFPDSFSSQVWVCSQWRFQSPEPFEGVFRGINTSYPVMLTNSPFDPITPLQNAFEAATAFNGSRLLVHNGHGHGVANHPSLCTMRAIGDYFTNGTLPEAGAECAPQKNGWAMVAEALQNNGTVTVTEDVRDEQERRMMERVYALALSELNA
ncbi:hypothetical protein KVT40_006291 [Elsinoe batatas]|uniref:Peptidase S33 tripeptidyl aminopeptidase-like C-terminal domain-containing protein n=1 Tax=Elsinoe batatas TaxID=2601811 RepID=A0A8K0PBK6_9PEZI|nr:hypothetical protein KVT40_006291 [Elsinoe batatas]